MSSFIIRQVGSDSDSCESQNTNIVAFLHVNTGMITIILQMSHFSIFSVDRSLLNGFEREENDKDDSSLVNILYYLIDQKGGGKGPNEGKMRSLVNVYLIPGQSEDIAQI